MKALLALVVLAQTSFALASNVICKDEKNVWNVTFELGEDYVNEIKFYKYGELYKDFGTQQMVVSKLRLPFSQKGFYTYEIKLGGAKYLDFERNFNGDYIDMVFPATFLLTSNPFSFEKHVICKITE